MIYLEGKKINWIVNDFCRNKINSGSVIIGVASNVKDGKIVSQMEYKELQGGGLYGIYTCGV
nr:hypothetical protein [Paeniclostridium ghonii]